jgi:putative hemolysin
MTLLWLGLLLLGSAVFSGSETAFYSLSRLRVAAEARRGSVVARLIDRLFRNPTGFLITLLVGNGLCLELLAHMTGRSIARAVALPAWGLELAVTLVLTPTVFFFGDLLPKDVFRRRPRRFFGAFAPVIALARLVFLPVVWPLQQLSIILERLLGVRARDLERALGRESVLEILREGARAGALAPRAQELALNVFLYRTRTVAEVLVPWGEVETVDSDADADAERRQVGASSFSRLPVVGTSGGARVVRGYLHQLDLLSEALADRPPRPPEDLVRPLLSLPSDLTVDRALARLRAAGQRMALVGTPTEPRGIVTLKDLVQTISGELGGW